MKILYLAQRIPYPPNKGDKIRTYHQIRYLSRGHEVFVAALYDQKSDLGYADELAALAEIVGLEYVDPRLDRLLSLRGLLLGLPLSVLYFYKKALQKKIDRFLFQVRPEVVFCFSSVMAQYVFSSGVIDSAYRPLLVMDFCDLDSDKWRQYGDTFPYPLNLVYRREARLLLEYEKKINGDFDRSLFVSGAEADLFARYYPQARDLHVICNGVDTTYFAPGIELGKIPLLQEDLADKLVLLFTGAMDYPANVDGVLWFYDKIYLNLRKQIPNLAFLIVGHNPDRKIQQLHGQQGVLVTGFVSDIRPYYQRADVCIAPLRLARGIQNKVLEAMAMGKAVVLTPKAAQGIAPGDKRPFLQAAEPQEFADHIQLLCQQDSLRQKLGQQAREFVEQRYSWESSLQALDNLFAGERF